ncbi:MAG: peptidoglycan-binding protein [Candidatus Taylorbacteria bacterium]|nr:peptidoglycan-binding protein [Candidatus Taylorbacteria bacterium]
MKFNLFSILIMFLVAGVLFSGTPTPTFALDFFPEAQNGTSTQLTNFTTNLHFGMRGNDVKRLQNILISQNLLGANLNTGFFGFSTFNALRSYQASIGLPATGFLGPMTRAVFNTGVLSNPTPTAPRATTTPGTASTTVVITIPPVATSTRPVTLSLTSTTTSAGQTHVNARVSPDTGDAHTVTLRATCPVGVSVSQGDDVCNSTITMPVIVSHGTYRSVFTFVNTSGSAQVVSLDGRLGPLVASTNVSVPSTMVVATSTPPVVVTPPATSTPPVTSTPTISQMIKQRGCELVRGRWSLSGSTGTCMFSAGSSDLNQERLQEWSCKQWGGRYSMCLSSCSSQSATATMCATVCTPGCTEIR